jgi:polysaccharide biosynthesis transport protein
MTTPTGPTEHDADLREYIRVLRARKAEVLIIVTVVAATAMFFAFRQTPIYQGQAKVLVKAVSTTGTAGVNLAPNMDTERELVLSQAVAQKVKSDLSLRTAEGTLLNHVDVAVISDTDLLVVKYSDPVPATAARLSNAFANAYVDFRTEQALAQFQAAAGAVQSRIDGIRQSLAEINHKILPNLDTPAQSNLKAERDTLIAQLGVLNQRLLDLQSNSSALLGAGEIVQQAEVPGAPVSPNKVRDGVLAVFAGLVLGVGFAFLRERLDDTVKTRQELEKRLGAPVIAVIPKIRTWRRSEEARLILRTDPKSPVSEAYQTLATTIRYMASQQQLKILMVTSSMDGEGKTTTSANLAVALAQAGRRVILVSADLRRPRLHRFFDLPNGPGLSELLSGTFPFTEIVEDPEIDHLRVLNAGAVPANPSGLLGSGRTVEALQSLREAFDFVVMDTPPVLAVADPSILAPLVDGTLFVMDAGHSSRSAIQHARDQLENAGGRIIGAVYNNFDPSKSASYYYNHYYYRYYGSDDWGSGNGGSHIEAAAGGRRLLKGRVGSGAAVGFEPYRAD